MTFSTSSTDRLLSINLALAQYPILCTRIRVHMRNMIFERGIMQQQAFELQVREMAIRSQEREGVRDPFSEEPAEMWDLRVSRIRDQLTDVVFSRHLTFQDFEQMVDEVLEERGITSREMVYINPEMAPQELVFEQGMAIEHMAPADRQKNEARLQEIKVVLIRALISDQLRYINIAKEWFTIADLAEVRRRKIGPGRIGGKAAGMLLALRILHEVADQDVKGCLRRPNSYFLGSDLMYSFMAINNLTHWNDQKYKTEEEMRAEYPLIVRDFENSSLPPDLMEKLVGVLIDVQTQPLIVRSSSLLEDNFGTAFAGKYESVFLPNQGNLNENLNALVSGIGRIYASTLNPNALLYRRTKGLQDYDERMGVIIQVVEGQKFGRFYFPEGAGVAFSRNLYRWAPQIKRDEGFVRLVWGLGTRAVDRVGNDYPRLIALSHPLLRPSNEPKAIRRYSQQFIDVIDLEDNQMKTLPVQEILNSHYPILRYIAQIDQDGYFTSLRSSLVTAGKDKLVLTFDELLRRTPFAEHMSWILKTLERNYHAPVDLEFTLHVDASNTGRPEVCITLLQCRPQSHMLATEQATVPADLKEEEIIFSSQFVVPQGVIERVDYVVFVPPEGYYSLETMNSRKDLARAIGRLNKVMAEEKFICVGPGRWGSSNSDLGVPIDYGDIYNAKSLVEMAGQGVGPEPEPSLGTHFFQDLIELHIYPLAIVLDHRETIFNHHFFYNMPNHLKNWIELDDRLKESLRVIRVPDYKRHHYLKVVMNDDENKAVAYIVGE